MFDLHHDPMLETGPEYKCAHCDVDIYSVCVEEHTWEYRHVNTDTAMSADRTHEAEAVGI